MRIQQIKVGSAANDGAGDPIRIAFSKTNDNVNELAKSLGVNAKGELPSALPIASGGTGATTASAARDNLGAASLDRNTFSGAQAVESGAGSCIVESHRMLRRRPSAVVYDGFMRGDVILGALGNIEIYRQIFGYSGGSADWGTGGIIANVMNIYIGGNSPHIRKISTNVDYWLPLTYATTTAAAANVNIASNGALTRSTSSLQYKTNVEALSDEHADNVIFSTKPIWYRSSCEVDNCEWSWYGLGAEDVAEIDPRLVHWRTTETQQVEREESFEEDGEIKTEVFQDTVEVPLSEPVAEGVQYDRFVPHLINVIQRLTKRIEVLENGTK